MFFLRTKNMGNRKPFHRLIRPSLLGGFLLLLTNPVYAQFGMGGGMGFPAVGAGTNTTFSGPPVNAVVAEEVGDGFYLLRATSRSSSNNSTKETSTGQKDNASSRNSMTPATNQEASNQTSLSENANTDGTAHETQILVRVIEREVAGPQPSATHATKEYLSHDLAGTSPNEAIIYHALARPISIDWSDGLSLREFETILADKMGVPVHLDERVLAGELGLDVHEPEAIRGKYDNISARSALRRLLSNVFETPLTYVIKDEVLLITDKQYAADNYISTRLYPWPLGQHIAHSNDASLIELIETTVEPITWQSVGGPGSIGTTGNGFVVSQTQEVHEQIVELMRSIEKTAGIEDGKPCLRVYHIADEPLREQLANSLATTCNELVGDRGDPNAVIQLEGNALTVRSSSRSFLFCADQVISSFQVRTERAYEWCAPFVDSNGVRMESHSNSRTISIMGGGLF